MILMNDSCEPEGKPVSRNNYSRRWYLHSVLQWTCLWGSLIVTRITHYVLRHCSIGVSKHLLPSKPNVLILLPSLFHLSWLLHLSTATFVHLELLPFEWRQHHCYWVNCCGIEGKSILRITYRRLLHKPEQAAILNDLTASLPFPIYYSAQHLN